MLGYNKENFTDDKIREKFKKHLHQNEEQFVYCAGNQQKGVIGGLTTYLIALTKKRLLLMEVDMKTWEEKKLTPLSFSDIESIKVKHSTMRPGNLPIPGFIIDRFFNSLNISKFIIKDKSGEKYKIQCSEGSTVFGFKMGLEGQEKGVEKMNAFVDGFEQYKNGISDSFFA